MGVCVLCGCHFLRLKLPKFSQNLVLEIISFRKMNLNSSYMHGSIRVLCIRVSTLLR